MTPATRIAINTLIQYCRTLINILLGFYSTRLVLEALGESDYGIYMLIAGVVGMLSFLTNALSITTQRFLSYHQSNNEKKTIIFSNSLAIHMGASVLLLIALEISGFFLFDGFLKIPADRISVAKVIYHCAIAMIAISVISSPFRAALVARENLVYVSIIDILDGCWKVVIAITITYSNQDRLIQYAFLTLGIYIFSFLSYFIYDYIKYPECKLPRKSHLNRGLIKKLSSFAGWSIYSSGCIIGRNQGISLVLNFFYGTILNAAYAISFQVSGAVNYICAAIQTAFSPRISMTEGEGNRPLMFYYSSVFSRISLLMMSMIGIPLYVFISEILSFWLEEVPAHTGLLCKVIIVACIADQISVGLITANRAIGKLRTYSLVVDSIKLLTCPALLILLWLKTPLFYAIWIYAIFEFISACVRIIILKYTATLSIKWWIKEVILKTSIPLLFLVFAWHCISYIQFSIYIILIEFCGVGIIYLLLCYFFSTDLQEKKYINKSIKTLFCRV